MSIISSCGEVPLEKDNYGSFILNKCDLFGQKRQSILRNDTLTLCCRMWIKKIKTSEIRFSSALHSLSNLWNIEELGSSGSHDTYIEQDNLKLYVDLERNEEKVSWTFLVREEPCVECSLHSFVDCALSITDDCGRVIDESVSLTSTKWWCDIEIFPNNAIINLQLKSIIAFHRGNQEQIHIFSLIRNAKYQNVSEDGSGVTLHKHCQTEEQLNLLPSTEIVQHKNLYEAVSGEIRPKNCQTEEQLKLISPAEIVQHKNVSEAGFGVMHPKSCQTEEQLNLHSLTKLSNAGMFLEAGSFTLGVDLLHLYRESAFSFSDVTLNTKGKSFPVHRSILAARSPVFRAMFEKEEMSQARSGVVDIDDVDSETMDRMLVFLYGGLISDLQWKEASALYYAADKYNVLPLKKKCSAILEAGHTADNACEALDLADKHSDQELMQCVVNFILEHKEIVSSAQWEQLEKSNLILAAKITRQLFLKK